MRFNVIDKTRYELCFSTGAKVFFSHGKPVAGYVPSVGYIKASPEPGFFSKVNGHVKKWLNGEEAREVKEENFENLISSSGAWDHSWYSKT